MKYLIESFYKSVLEGTPEPIPHREILLTTQIMDAIFRQLDVPSSRVHAPFQAPMISALIKRHRKEDQRFECDD